MKDLRFTTNDGAVDVTLRVDLIDNTSDNLTVFEINYAASLTDEQRLKMKIIFGQIKQLHYTKQFMIDFAESNDYDLTIADTDGGSFETLYEVDESASAS